MRKVTGIKELYNHHKTLSNREIEKRLDIAQSQLVEAYRKGDQVAIKRIKNNEAVLIAIRMERL